MTMTAYIAYTVTIPIYSKLEAQIEESLCPCPHVGYMHTPSFLFCPRNELILSPDLMRDVAPDRVETTISISNNF